MYDYESQSLEVARMAGARCLKSTISMYIHTGGLTAHSFFLDIMTWKLCRHFCQAFSSHTKSLFWDIDTFAIYLCVWPGKVWISSFKQPISDSLKSQAEDIAPKIRGKILCSHQEVREFLELCPQLVTLGYFKFKTKFSWLTLNITWARVNQN